MDNRNILSCENRFNVATRGIWHNESPLKAFTPLFFFQISVVFIASHVIHFFLKPLGQSTLVSQILGGLLFGPSGFGAIKKVGETLFPWQSGMVFKTVASFGCSLYIFVHAVKIETNMLIHPKRPALIIALSAFSVTFLLTMSMTYLLHKTLNHSVEHATRYVAATHSLATSAAVSGILTQLDLLNTDVGRLALSVAVFSDLLAACLAAFLFSLNGYFESPCKLASLWIFLSTLALAAVICFVLRPIFKWMSRHCPVGKPVAEINIVCVFCVLLVTEILGEVVGQHYLFGPYTLGMVVPDGPPLGAALVEKLETFANGFFYPIFLALVGLGIDLFKVHLEGVLIVLAVVVFSFLVKMGAVLSAALYLNLGMREAVVLGLLLNAKGIMELFVCSVGKETFFLDRENFTLTVMSVMLVTVVITPLIKFLYHPSKQYLAIRRSTIQHAKRDADFRILVCIHRQDNVPTVINLLEVSHATEESPVSVIALVLVELVGRTTPILVAHEGDQNLHRISSTTAHIVNALKLYKEHNEGDCCSVQSFTSISYFQTMHADICKVAAEKRANIVILPFHKTWAIDGTIGSVNPSIRGMNINVLERAPCSVGILVDRGIMQGSSSVLTSQELVNVGVFYIGGPDDAECLAYGARMSRHENVNLVVIRYLCFGNENTKDRKVDTELINEYRQANVGNERFRYIEEVVRDGVGLAASIKGMVECFDLMLVGRDHHESPILMGLDQWSECPELGVVGDMLASSDLESTASVLVVQQQRLGGKMINFATNLAREQPIHDVPEEPVRPSLRNGTSTGNGGSWAISIERGDN